MLPFIVLAVALVFLALLYTGLLDTLSSAATARRRRRADQPPDRLESRPPDQEMSRRLEVFENFIDKLSGQSEDDEPKR